MPRISRCVASMVAAGAVGSVTRGLSETRRVARGVNGAARCFGTCPSNVCTRPACTRPTCTHGVRASEASTTGIHAE